MSESCDCCVGVHVATPRRVVNRPGLPRLGYRIGTHGSFLASMVARLSSRDHPSLATLTARDPDDASIALLDGWATIADVLTFYQEQIANEGYLRTATERRSILELGRLVGWVLRPGISATAFLSFTVDPDPQDPAKDPDKDRRVTIPKGSQAQSVPDPGPLPPTQVAPVALPQTFETDEDLEARALWSRLEPRRRRPAWIQSADLDTLETLYLQGIITKLKPDGRLVLEFSNPGPYAVRIAAVTTDIDADITTVTLFPKKGGGVPVAGPAIGAVDGGGVVIGQRRGLDAALLDALRKPASIPPPGSRALAREATDVFKAGSSESTRLLTTLDRRLAPTLDRALASLPGGPSSLTSLSAMRIKCQPFGATASLRPVLDGRGIVVGSEEWPLAGEATFGVIGRIPSDFFSELTVTMEIAGQAFEALLKDGTKKADFGDIGHVDVSWNMPIEVTLTAKGSDKLVVTMSGNVVDPAKVQVNDFAIEVDHGSTVRRSSDGRHYEVSFGDKGDRLTLSVMTRQPLEPLPNVIFLDAEYEGILPGSWVVIERPQFKPPVLVAKADEVRTVARADYGLTAKVTRITLSEDWLDVEQDLLLSAIREANVFVLSEPLQLALEPFDDDICGATIELRRLYPGLQTGRWIIVEGERTDVPTTGVRTAELAMIAGVVQGADPIRTTDTVHTYLTLARPLAYCYRRATATIHGNVAKASHGETRIEPLGSGEATRPLQTFTLRAKPLTYLPDRNALGAASTLELRVDTIRWSEAESLVELGPKDHGYILKTDDADVTTATTGTGRNGARLPTGQENVRAVYRSGSGIGGNLAAARISQLMSRPLGVSGVINPLPSTGGADRESLEQGRRNLPLGVLSLDRLVSIQDYEDFTRARAGIGQASAVSLSDGTRRVVHLTIAGAGDAPIDPTSDLYRALREALQEAGDPAVPVTVAVRELALLVIAADVRIDDDRRWDLMEPVIRAALLDAFSFDRRRLGQDVFVSEVQAAIQEVPGVRYSDVNTLATVAESITPDELENLADQLSLPGSGRVPVSFARRTEGGLRPAQIALLSPAVRDTLILRNLPS